MNCGWILGALSGAALLAQPALAEVHHSKIAVKAADGGFIASDVFIEHKTGESTALVLDPLINNYNGRKPLTAEVVADSKTKISYAWKLKVTHVGTNATVKYRLTRQKADGAATISAQALGYTNHYTSTGTCKIAK